MDITHLSYSQYNTYKQCPRQWYLSKVAKAEEKQTWYLPIGTTVHTAVEVWIESGVELPLDVYFYGLISKQLEVEPDMSKWLAGGPKDNPIVEDRALDLVRASFLRAQEFLEDFDVWHVELDVSGPLPGLEVPLKAFVDAVGEHKKHGPAIVDWKTGKTKPKDNFQLETYRALVLNHDRSLLEPMATKGLFVMLNPDASQARPIDLSHVDPAAIGAKYQEVYEGMKDRIYRTDHGFKCKFCFHQDSCLLNAGPTPQAKYYDKAHIDGYPF